MTTMQGFFNTVTTDADAPNVRVINTNTPSYADNPQPDTQYSPGYIWDQVLDTDDSTTPSLRIVVVT